MAQAQAPSPPMEVNDVDAARGEVTYFLLTHDVLSVDDLYRRVAMPSCGAVATFCGITRDNFKGKEVMELYYEAYDAMAIKEMRKIADDARKKWPDVKGVAIAHRKGIVPVAESSVVIACSSPHRVAAMEAVRYCIDTLKEMVPIWKKEIYKEGVPTWKQNQEYLESQLFKQDGGGGGGGSGAKGSSAVGLSTSSHPYLFAAAVLVPILILASSRRGGN